MASGFVLRRDTLTAVDRSISLAEPIICRAAQERGEYRKTWVTRVPLEHDWSRSTYLDRRPAGDLGH